MKKQLEFCRFITALVYQLLDRLPTSPRPNDPSSFQEHIDFINQYHKSSLMLHKLLHRSKTQKLVTIPKLIHSLALVHKVHCFGNQMTAKGSEPHLLAIALLISIKTNDDHSYGWSINQHWAKAMNENNGITVEQLNQMERDFLACVGYEVYLSNSDYIKWFDYVQSLAKAWETKQELEDCHCYECTMNCYKLDIPPVNSNAYIPISPVSLDAPRHF